MNFTEILQYLNIPKSDTLESGSILSRISDKRKVHLYEGIGSMLSSEVDILTTLEILHEEEYDEKMRTGINKIITMLKSGNSFTVAFSRSFRISKYEFATLKAGESSARLQLVLLTLATHFKNRSENKRQLISTLSYPIIVLVTSISILYFMLTFMVPMFIDSFKRLNTELPYITRVVIKCSAIFSSLIPLLPVVLLLIVIGWYIAAKNAGFRLMIANYLFSTPGIRNVIINQELNRFFTIMSTLLSAKVQLTEALRHAADAAIFPTFSERLLNIECCILNGETLHASLRNTRFFPVKVITLVKMGEETNTLEKVFSALRTEYIQKSKHRQEMLKSIAEPLLILIMGLITGVIVIGMYLPIFQMSMVE